LSRPSFRHDEISLPPYNPSVIVIIDNYDSFTYNLVQAIGAMDTGASMRVVLNDKTSTGEIAGWTPSHIIISPGPGSPADAGISMDVIQTFAGKVPILGVCLGHQCIGQAFGGRVVHAERIMHGKTSEIHHDGAGIFAALPTPFTAARYHSLMVAENPLPAGFVRTAWTDQNELMGIRHEAFAIDGVQFHPESFLTPLGVGLIRNFLVQPARSAKAVACSGNSALR
jgi:anthranilate synthase/aminodeoxychorismate synthase-like glutamine amidotransferase